MTAETASHHPRRTTVLLLRWLVPVGVIVAFVLTGHLGEAISALSAVELSWSIPLIVVGVALPLSHAWRWCFLLQRVGEAIPMASSSRITALASLINYAAPGFLGAPAKAVLARDAHRVPVSRSLPTLAVEQILDALMLAVAGAIAVLLAGPTIIAEMGIITNLEDAGRALITLLIFLLLALALWFAMRRFARPFLNALGEAARMLVSSRKHRPAIVGLTGARWVFDMSAIGLASIAVGLRLSLLDILLIANLSLLAGLIAPIPGGIGVREAVMASLAGVIGVSIPAILALSVLHRAGLAIGLPIVLAGARAVEWRTR